MKKKILPLFIFLVLTAVTHVATAQGVMPLNGSVNGNLTSATTDVWDLTTPSDGLIQLTFTATSPADLFITLYDNNGTSIIGGSVESFNSTTVTLVADGLAPGTYHIKISPYGSNFGAYTIADNFSPAILPIDAEPNGNAATAVSVPLNSSKTGHVGYYYNNSRDTADWYKVTTTGNGLLRVYLETARGSATSTTATNMLDVNVTLYDNDGTTQLGSVEVFNGYNPWKDSITRDGLAPGTYYIKVQPYSTNQFATYTITDSLFTSSVSNDPEPDGNAANANPIPLNSSKTGQVGYYYNNLRDTADWFKVTTTSDGLLRVYLSTSFGSKYSTSTTNQLDVNVTLYDKDGTTLLGEVEVFNGYGPATNMITADGLAPGTYYIKVQPYSTNEFANYTITDSLFTSGLPNDAEPDGNKLAAVTLPVNTPLTGHVGYYYNHQRDTADWYKVTTNADGLMRVYITTATSSIYSTTSTDQLDVNVTLYDNDGTTQLGSVEVFNGYGPATNMITSDGLAPGTYYIKVQPFSTAEFANYTITDSLFTSGLPNDTEPDGNKLTAVTLPVNSALTGHVGYYYNSLRDTADWFKVTTTGDGLLRVYLSTSFGSKYSTSTTNQLDVNVTLYDNDGTTVLGAVEVFNGYGPATNMITADGLAAGTYYIKVQPFSTNEFANYKITDSLFQPVLINDTEPNGNTGTAISLPLNTSNTGHVGYYYNHLRDTTDWYKVTTTTTGQLMLTLSMTRGSIFSNNSLDVIMVLYGSDGATQFGFEEIYNLGGPGTDSIKIASLAAGTYYLKIQPFSTNEFADYTITNGVVPPPINFTVTTAPAGLNILVDGVTYSGPQTVQWVPGSNHTIGTTSPQTSSSGNNYVWNNWSDGGSISHSVTAPAVSTTYTANFGPQIVATPTVTNAACFGSTGSVSFSVSGGVLPYAYKLTNSGNGNVLNSTTGNFTGLPAGSYGYSVTDANMQFTSGNIAITQPAQVIIPPIAFTGGTSVCSGSVVPLSDAAGGGIWSSTDPSVASVSSAGVVTFGTLLSTVTVTIRYDVTSGTSCSSGVSVTFTIYPPLNVGPITGSSNVCTGKTILLANNTTGGVWTSNSANATVNSVTGLVTGVNAGSATITYTVGSGSCHASVTSTITVNATPTVSAISGSKGLNKGSTLILTDATPGGTWSSSNSSVATINSTGTVNGIASGSCVIYYIVSNTAGCSDTARQTITVYDALTAKVSSGKITCHGATTILQVNVSGGSGAYLYSLNGNKFQSVNMFTVHAGIYIVMVKDTVTGQSTITGTFIAQPFPVEIRTINEEDATHGLSNGSVSLRTYGGNAPYTYSINGGATYQSSGTFKNLTAGNYQIAVRDDNGCIELKDITIYNYHRGRRKNWYGESTDSQTPGEVLKGDESMLEAIAYPNPSQSYFMLDLRSSVRGNVEIQVFDMLGHIVYHTTGDVTDSFRFGQDFAKGMYVVKIFNKEETKIIKIIKQ